MYDTMFLHSAEKDDVNGMKYSFMSIYKIKTFRKCDGEVFEKIKYIYHYKRNLGIEMIANWNSQVEQMIDNELAPNIYKYKHLGTFEKSQSFNKKID